MIILLDKDLPAQFQARAMYGLFNDKAAFEARCAAFKQWREDNKVFYYSRPRESFFRWEAFELAAAAGCDKVILEDLS